MVLVTRPRTLLVFLIVLKTSVVKSDAEEATYHAAVGQQAVISCPTKVDQAVDFGFQFHQEAEIRDIYHGGNIVNGQAKRYTFRRDSSTDYKLIILNVTMNDSGIYICTERAGIGDVHRIRLNVTEASRQHIPMPSSNDVLVADVGQSVTLPCRSSFPVGVDWTFVSSPTADHTHICQNGQLIDGHSTKYSLDRTVQGDYSLVVRKVSPTDAGTYLCTENGGSGQQHTTLLIAAKPQKTQVAMIGSTASLVCMLSDTRTPIRWHYYRPGSRVRQVIYNGQEVTDSSVRHRVFVNGQRSALVITDVRLSDGGLYECNPVSSAVIKKTFELTVLESEPTCDVYPSYEVHEHQDVEVRCDLSYSGNLKPGLLCSPNSKNGTITHTVFGATIVAKLGSTCVINNAYLTCVVKFTGDIDSETTDYLFRWKSTERLRVSGSCSGQAAVVHQQRDTMLHGFVVIATVALIVAVIAVVIQFVRSGWLNCSSCRNEFGRMHSTSCWPLRCRRDESRLKGADHGNTDKLDRTTSTASTLDYETQLQPMLLCPPSRHELHGATTSCSAEPSRFIEDNDVVTENQTNEKLIDIDPSSPALSPIFKYCDCTDSGNTIRGISVLGGRLYVARSDQKKIEIYDTKTMKLIAPDESLELCDSDPWFMASCAVNRCLYVSFKLSSKIQKIGLEDKGSDKTWKTSSPPDGISLTPEATLLVAFRAASELVEFNADGKEIRKIELPFSKPRHAISLGSDKYLVCYGVYNEDQRGLEEVVSVQNEKPKRRIIQSDLDHPLHLAVHDNGFVLVADYNGKKIAMLDKELKYVGKVTTDSDPPVDTPFMLCFDEQCEVLYVADHGADHRVFAFNVSCA